MYTIKKASMLCGVSPDMIRHYEKMGILRPKRDPDNHYRMYTESDMNLITMVKLYSSFGIDLKTCATMVSRADMATGYAQLQKSIAELTWQQLFLQHRLNASRRLAAALDGYMRGLPYRIAKGGDVLLYPRDGIAPGEDYVRFVASAPVFHYYYRVRKEALMVCSGDSYPSDVGILVEGPPLPAMGQGQLLKRKWLYQTWLSLPSNTPLRYDTLAQHYEAITKEGYEIGGDLILYQIMGSNHAQGNLDVVCVEIPITRSKKID